MADYNDAKWYVIHTYSGYENKVAKDLETIVENRKLQDYIMDIKIPTEVVTEVKEDGTQKQYERKIFPGYVLIKMIVTDDSWFIVRNTRGVTGFVGPASKPVPLSDAEVESLGVEKHSVEVAYLAGLLKDANAAVVNANDIGIIVDYINNSEANDININYKPAI